MYNAASDAHEVPPGLHLAHYQYTTEHAACGLITSSMWVPCRTLLYGGIAANPRSHLRLVYEANPLSFIAEQVTLLALIVWGSSCPMSGVIQSQAKPSQAKPSPLTSHFKNL